jgi:hypothetical protein
VIIENKWIILIFSWYLAQFDIIIPPKGGHGYDIYTELGAYRVLVYSRYNTDETNPDTIIGNDFARIGIIKNSNNT